MESLVPNQITNQTSCALPRQREGRSLRSERPSIAPTHSTLDKIKKHRGRPKNKKPPDGSTEKLRAILPIKTSPKELQIPSPSSATHPADAMSEPNSFTASFQTGQDYVPQDEDQFMGARELQRYYGSERGLKVDQPSWPLWRRKPANIQLIENTFCRHSECLTEAEFTSNFTNATVTYDPVLLSKLYRSSYIWEETVRELGFVVEPDRPPPRLDPRTGGVLEPIGSLPLYVKLHGPEHTSIKLVHFAVLPGSSAATGVRAIIGEQDLRSIYERDLDIDRYNRERVNEYWRNQ
ncbi:hypothetical protein QBC42DRAFT_99482 [Cladorrhinum samala]|uniref:Uncharacterized protein n=1 Tax=Cladorrhinum samala TaxID=585594 RepID=A0AAV9HJD7_9PEZI|nr:hypothetical protein QBC42DRAFT_99482 [Cladorrhinum samala]